MPLRLPFRTTVAATFVLALFALPAAARGQAPATELPPGARALNMAVVGALPLEGGVHGDVWSHADFAYVGTWREPDCPSTGVKVIDLANPTQPRLAGLLAQHADTSQEDIVVRTVSTDTFRGDLLAVGLQRCGDGGLAGVEFWDVTNPLAPQRLGMYDVGGTSGVHELELVQRPSDGRVLALLAVPMSEAYGLGGDLRIVDASDPRNPVEVASWGAGEGLNLDLSGGQGQFSYVYLHSVSSNPGGTRAYLSYWDAGFIILDLADPASPALLGHAAYAPDDEGNAHSAAVSGDERWLVTTDEDIHAAQYGSRIDAPAELAGGVESVEGAVTLPLSESDPLSGELVYLGRACPDGNPEDGTGVVGGDPLLGDPSGRIALIDRGGCFFALKLLRAQEAGAIAAVVVNSLDGPPVEMGGVEGVPELGIPGVMIRKELGERVKVALAAGTPVTMSLADDIVYQYNDWGYLRLWDISDPASPRQLGRFGTANTFTDREHGPPDDGQYAVHNPLVDGSIVYASWYSDGVRIIDISDPIAPREVGYFVPPPTPALSTETSDRPMVWGVAKHGDLLLASDMNYGLWILADTRP